MPSKWYFQWIYLLYRWIALFFFLAYLIQSGLISSNNPLFFIYLTHWGLLVYTFHFLWSATFVTIRYFQVHVFCKKTYEVPREKETSYQLYDKPVGCCGVREDSTFWYQKVQWLLFTVGNGTALAITVLFWSVLYRPEDSIDHISLVVHAVNGVVALLDIWVSGVPVRILHVIYTIFFCGVYSAFTGIYFAAGGVNDDGDRFVYPALNYEKDPGTASAYVILSSLVLVPLLHLFVWGVYLLREGLLYLIKHVCLKGNKNGKDNRNQSAEEMAEAANL